MKKNIDSSLKDLGKLIKSERKARNLTQTQLGELSGTSINFISQIEAGKATAHIGKVFRVLQILGYEFYCRRGSQGVVIHEKGDIFVGQLERTLKGFRIVFDDSYFQDSSEEPTLKLPRRFSALRARLKKGEDPGNSSLAGVQDKISADCISLPLSGKKGPFSIKCSKKG